MRWFGLVCAGVGGWILLQPPTPARAESPRGHGCPPEMVRVRSYCVDRFEIATVDDQTGHALSPYYPPEPRLIESIRRSWQIERESVGEPAARELPLPELPPLQQQSASYRPRAVSRAGQIPQGYLSYGLAKQACELAHKRLCTEDEWVMACEGRHARKFPYGENFEVGRCNVYRTVHPAQLLHAASWYGHRDPRLNLVVDPVDGPLLRLTGATASCASQWDDDRIFDMVGNLDEWVEADPDADTGVFVGGFYARSTREGCKSRVSNHAKIYYDYSLGTRCCKSL